MGQNVCFASLKLILSHGCEILKYFNIFGKQLKKQLNEIFKSKNDQACLGLYYNHFKFLRKNVLHDASCYFVYVNMIIGDIIW